MISRMSTAGTEGHGTVPLPPCHHGATRGAWGGCGRWDCVETTSPLGNLVPRTGHPRGTAPRCWDGAVGAVAACPPGETSPQPCSDVSARRWVPRVLQGDASPERDIPVALPAAAGSMCPPGTCVPRMGCPYKRLTAPWVPWPHVPRKGCPRGAAHHQFPSSAGATCPPISAFPVPALRSLQPPSPLGDKASPGTG